MHRVLEFSTYDEDDVSVASRKHHHPHHHPSHTADRPPHRDAMQSLSSNHTYSRPPRYTARDSHTTPVCSGPSPISPLRSRDDEKDAKRKATGLWRKDAASPEQLGLHTKEARLTGIWRQNVTKVPTPSRTAAPLPRSRSPTPTPETDNGDGSFLSDAFQMTEGGDSDVAMVQQHQQQQQPSLRRPDFLKQKRSSTTSYDDYFAHDPLSPLQRERASRKEARQQEEHHHHAITPADLMTCSPVRHTQSFVRPTDNVFASPAPRVVDRLSPDKQRVVVLPSSPSPSASPERFQSPASEGRGKPSMSTRPLSRVASPAAIPATTDIDVTELRAELEDALVRNDVLCDDNDRLLAWNQELQDELHSLTTELQTKCDRARQVDRLEAKLRDKAALCEQLRTKVHSVSERVRRHSLEEEEDNPDLNAHIANIEREHAETRLLYNEREAELLKLRKDVHTIAEERDAATARIAPLEAQVAELATGFEDVQRHQEALHASETHLRTLLRERELEADDVRDAARIVEEQLRADLRILERQLAEAHDEGADWEGRYRELRTSYNALAVDAHGDEVSAPTNHHACHEQLADCVSDTVYLQQVMRAYISERRVPPSLRAGNDEPLADRRRRLCQKSIEDLCTAAAEHTRLLYSLMLETIARQDEANDANAGGGGCDVQ